MQFINKKVAFCCYPRLQAAPVAGTGVLRPNPYAELPLYIGNQRVLGAVGLPIGQCLDVGPLFCIRAGAQMKKTCSGLRSHLEAVIAAESYFFE